MTCSVYKLTFPSGKLYIGVSKDPERRLIGHARARSLVGHAIRKHGRPRLDVLMVSTRAFCYEMEAGLTAAYNTVQPNGYNMKPGGEGGVGHKFTPEQRRRSSEAQLGKVKTPATREKMRAAQEHRAPITDETRAKMSEAAKNRPARTEENCRKLREAAKRRGPRQPHTEETKKRISEAAMKRPRRPHTAETRKRISIAMMNRTRTTNGRHA